MSIIESKRGWKRRKEKKNVFYNLRKPYFSYCSSIIITPLPKGSAPITFQNTQNEEETRKRFIKCSIIDGVQS
jgi:hypothetical protein